jgi:hypothetical protein
VVVLLIREFFALRLESKRAVVKRGYKWLEFFGLSKDGKGCFRFVLRKGLSFFEIVTAVKALAWKRLGLY